MTYEDHPADRLLKEMHGKYVLVGKSRVRSWHMWLLVGIVVGALVGIFFVANRTDQFVSSEASGVLMGVSERDLVAASQLVQELMQLSAQAKSLATLAKDPNLSAVLAQMSSLVDPHLKTALRGSKKASNIVGALASVIAKAIRPQNTPRTVLNYLGSIDIRLDALKALLPPPPTTFLQVAPAPVPPALPSLVPGVANQTIGVFGVSITGESASSVSMSGVSFVITVEGAAIDRVSDVALYDSSGATMAGPKNPSGDSVDFTDAMVIPIGSSTFYLKARIAADTSPGAKVTVSTNPQLHWHNVRTQSTNVPVLLSPDSSVAWATLTVASAGSLTTKLDPAFGPQNLIAGQNAAEVARIQLDASNSSSDLEVRRVRLLMRTSANLDPDDFNTLQLFDGNSQPLTTGVHIVNLAGHTVGEHAVLIFDLDQPLTVVHGSDQQRIKLKANIGAGVAGGSTVQFGFVDHHNGGWEVFSKSTGAQVPSEFVPADPPILSIVTAGGFNVSTDPSAPAEKWVVAGSTGVVVNVLRFTATTEDIALTKLRLQLRFPATAGPDADITSISLWDSATMILKKVAPAFTGGVEDFVFPMSGDGSFLIPKDSFKKMIIKVDLAGIGTALSGTAGEPVIVDYDAAGTALGKNNGLGLSSGRVTKAVGPSTVSAGIRYFRSVPTVQRLSIPVTTLTSGNLVLYKFQVSADPAYDVALGKFTFEVATTGVTSFGALPASLTLRDVTDGNKRVSAATGSAAEFYSDPKRYSSTGALMFNILADTTDYLTPYVPVPAGQAHVFELRGNVMTDGSGDSVSVKLLGDAAYPVLPTPMGSASEIETSGSHFMWSDYSGDAMGGVHSLVSRDWTNGYKVPGLLATGLDPSTISARANSLVRFARVIDGFLSAVAGGWAFLFSQ